MIFQRTAHDGGHRADGSLGDSSKGQQMAKKTAGMSGKKAVSRPATKKTAARPPAKTVKRSTKRVAKKGKATADKSASAPRSTRPVAAGPSAKARALDLLQWVHGMTNLLIDGVPESASTFQTSPADNHVLWNIGHLATSYAWFTSLINGRAVELPEGYMQLFGYQSKPNPDRSVYPPLEEVRRAYSAAFKQLASTVESQSDAELAMPTKTDSGGFAKDRLDAIYKAAWHDGWHGGQISTIRRALALPSVM